MGIEGLSSGDSRKTKRLNGLKPCKEALGLWRQELQGIDEKEVMPGTLYP